MPSWKAATRGACGWYILRAELDAKGAPIGPLDLMIASHAVTLGAALVTADVRGFRRVPGLRNDDRTA